MGLNTEDGRLFSLFLVPKINILGSGISDVLGTVCAFLFAIVKKEEATSSLHRKMGSDSPAPLCSES